MNSVMLANKVFMILHQSWANYGLGARCGPLGFLIQAAKHVQMMLIIHIIFIRLPLPWNAQNSPTDGAG